MGGMVRIDDNYLHDRYILLTGQGVKLPSLSDRRKKLSSEDWMNDMVKTDMYQNAPDPVKASMIKGMWGVFKKAGFSALQNDTTMHPTSGQSFGDMIRNDMLNANVSKAELFGLKLDTMPPDLQNLIRDIRSNQ